MYQKQPSPHSGKQSVAERRRELKQKYPKLTLPDAEEVERFRLLLAEGEGQNGHMSESWEWGAAQRPPLSAEQVALRQARRRWKDPLSLLSLQLPGIEIPSQLGLPPLVLARTSRDYSTRCPPESIACVDSGLAEGRAINIAPTEFLRRSGYLAGRRTAAGLFQGPFRVIEPPPEDFIGRSLRASLGHEIRHALDGATELEAYLHAGYSLLVQGLIHPFSQEDVMHHLVAGASPEQYWQSLLVYNGGVVDSRLSQWLPGGDHYNAGLRESLAKDRYDLSTAARRDRLRIEERIAFLEKELKDPWSSVSAWLFMDTLRRHFYRQFIGEQIAMTGQPRNEIESRYPFRSFLDRPSTMAPEVEGYIAAELLNFWKKVGIGPPKMKWRP